MPTRDLQADNGQQAGRLRAYSPNRSFNRKNLSVDQRKHPSEKELEETLSTALLAADSELGQIVHEVDEISKALKANSPDAQALRVAVHPAVWGAVKQALLDRELRYLALTDDLTCLYNRRGFFAAATQQLKLARRNAQSMLLLFCDLDNFKRINDSYGHREGDLALVRMADALGEVFRDSDTVARLGGDEFAVLASEVSKESQEAILRRLKESLKKLNANEPRYELSLSVGVARFDPERPVSLGELMAQADRAMYEKKRSRLQPCPSRT